MPSKSALIVDDSTTAQYRLKKMLRPFNLHIDVVDSGEAALRYLATNEPDVIFMDHLMPGMDGFRALQIIKSHPETAMIPVIMYTSKSGDVYTGQARALGALDVVTKDTINAADLSKVMKAIHIYRDGDEPAPKAPAPEEAVSQPQQQKKSKDNQTDFIHAANKVSALGESEATIERRIPNATGADQARNLELRLGHLEHTLEDSRRFITSRVVRELQSLRQSMKQELGELLSQSRAQAASHQEVTEVVKVAPSSGWSILGVALIVIVLVTVVLYFGEINQTLEQTQNQQQQINEQLKALAQQNQNVTTTKLQSQPQAVSASPTTIEKTADTAEKPANNAYVADLAWAFNQSAALQFNQNNIDPKVVIRLHEFLNRIINSGFKGSVLVNIYVGNFCVFINNLGQAQLPPETANMANCMLSSEVYGLDRVMKQYANEIETVMGNLSRQQKKAVSIVINSLIGTDSYPERTPAMAAKDWNSIAQSNNRIELRLEPSSSGQ